MSLFRFFCFFKGENRKFDIFALSIFLFFVYNSKFKFLYLDSFVFFKGENRKFDIFALQFFFRTK